VGVRREELRQRLKAQYKQQLGDAHAVATRVRGRGLAMSQIVITWVIPPPIKTALANKASPQALAHELGLDKLTQVVSVELSFEQLLQEARQVLRGLLLLLASPVKASSLASPASSSSSKSGRGGGEDDDRRWGRAQEALDGFVYQHPRSGRSKTVTNEDAFVEMLDELALDADKQMGGLPRPTLLAEPSIILARLAG